MQFKLNLIYSKEGEITRQEWEISEKDAYGMRNLAGWDYVQWPNITAIGTEEASKIIDYLRVWITELPEETDQIGTL